MKDDRTIRKAILTKENLKEVASQTKYSVRELALMLRDAEATNRTVVVLLTPLHELWLDKDAYSGRHRLDGD